MTRLDQRQKRTVGVVGAGTMGSGIAQVAAVAGERVLLFDERSSVAARVPGKIGASLGRLVEKQRLTIQRREEILSRLTIATAIDELSAADLVIEAIVEEDHAKRTLFRELSRILRDETVLATNTSSLSVTALAASYRLPDMVVGMHFFNPAPIMELVEVVSALQTSADVMAAVTALLTAWGKEPVLVKDTPGFLVNRIARPFYGEALRMLEEGLARPEEIDAAMRSVCGFRMGPFELMDLIGNDINAAVTESIYRHTYYDRRYLPSILQRRYVEAGYLGRKSGRGFYVYADERPPVPSAVPPHADELTRRILVLMINEAVETFRLGLASRDDIERAMTKGTHVPKGLLHWADDLGAATVLADLHALFERYGDDRYRPSPLLRSMAASGERFFP